MATAKDVEPLPTHPEEFRSTYECRIGKSITLQGTLRMTPAGIVTLAIAVSSIVLSCAYLVRSSRLR